VAVVTGTCASSNRSGFHLNCSDEHDETDHFEGEADQ
jgi:hypothetical protein